MCHEEDYQTILQDLCTLIGADHRGSSILSDEQCTDHYYNEKIGQHLGQ